MVIEIPKREKNQKIIWRNNVSKFDEDYIAREAQQIQSWINIYIHDTTKHHNKVPKNSERKVLKSGERVGMWTKEQG